MFMQKNVLRNEYSMCSKFVLQEKFSVLCVNLLIIVLFVPLRYNLLLNLDFQTDQNLSLV
jgi:hypothetical protein